MAKFYITNAIPYVNAKPHIGHALEFVQSDTIARYHRLLGEETLLLCGGDENALKNVQAAEKEGENVQEFVDKNTQAFYNLAKNLHVQFDIWQKGSSEQHYKSSQKLWELCEKAGDIYKKSYTGLYCVGCEQFYTKNELDEQGECFEHPGKKLETVSEENYFFRLSKYQDKLLQLIIQNTYAIIPDFRKNEMISFIKSGLQDFSVSRSNERAKNWGVPVPNDPSQRIYVWFDALHIYQSGIGFGWNEEKYKKWWPADVHVIGKGIIRFHSIYWPAILMSAGLELPKKLFVHEYFTVNGQKMSKTLGNVIDPEEMIKKYGTDALRYYFLAKFSPFSDGDFSEEKLKEVYNADLANGLGNVVARIAKLCERSACEFNEMEVTNISSHPALQYLETFNFNEALKVVWQGNTESIRWLDQQINQEQPWKLSGKDLEEKLYIYVQTIRKIALVLQPFMPHVSEKISAQFKGPKISSGKPLFPRIS